MSAPEQTAITDATNQVRQLLAQSKDPRTVLGRARPTVVAYHATLAAITAYQETLAHEQARAHGGVCRNCGRSPQ